MYKILLSILATSVLVSCGQTQWKKDGVSHWQHEDGRVVRRMTFDEMCSAYPHFKVCNPGEIIEIQNTKNQGLQDGYRQGVWSEDGPGGDGGDAGAGSGPGVGAVGGASPGVSPGSGGGGNSGGGGGSGGGDNDGDNAGPAVAPAPVAATPSIPSPTPAPPGLGTIPNPGGDDPGDGGDPGNGCHR